MMGLGPALREEIQFQGGRLTNGRFAGETPIIAVAPAIANAVFDATGKRVRSMPIRVPRG